MKKSKIILIVVLVLAGLTVFYFAYGVIKKRYFPTGRENANQTVGENSAEQQNNLENADQETAFPEDGIGSGNIRPDITSADCDKNCDSFAASADNFKYCREVCGQTKILPKSSEEDCAALTGLEKDYCLRDLAVSKLDPSICKKISDAKLQSVCKSRVAEEILN